MPIHLEERNRAFIRADETTTVGELLKKLQAKHGQSWWFAVVRRSDGQWGAGRIDQLVTAIDKLGPAIFEQPLRLFSEFMIPRRTVEGGSMGTEAAEALRTEADTPGKILIIMEGNEPVGVLYHVVRSYSLGGQILELYGRYMDLDEDERALWRPEDRNPPTCPHCGAQDFYRLDPQTGKYLCAQCSEIIP